MFTVAAVLVVWFMNTSWRRDQVFAPYKFFGTDHIGFSACSLSLPAGSQCTDAVPVLRHYTSFSQAADENALSRVLIGIHFRHATEERIQHGRKIAKRAVNLFLKPVH